MNSSTVNNLNRALAFALRRASERLGTWDEEFARGLRLLVFEAVLSKLDRRFLSSDAVASTWNCSGLNPTSFEAVRRLFQDDFNGSAKPLQGTVDLEDAAAVLDGVWIDSGRYRTQRDAGAVFTPPMLAFFLASEVIGPASTSWPAVSRQRVIDPACGAGSLMLATLAEGRKKLNATRLSFKNERLRDWAIGQVRGIDRDRDTASVAAGLLGLSLGVDAELVLGTGMVRVADSLLEYDDEIDVGSYDRVIMNPPWIKTKNLDAKNYSDRLREDSRYTLTTRDGQGDLDLYQFFLERAYALAANGGRIGFIVPGSFLRSARAARLRYLYLTAGHLVRLDEFWNQERVFPIHSMFRFVTGVFDKGVAPGTVDARFRVGSVESLVDQQPKQLWPSLFVDESNSTARVIPEVITPSGLALFRKISSCQPALGSRDNPWAGRVRFKRELDMTGHRHLFTNSSEIDHDSVVTSLLHPVYEGRMVHQFDSSAKTYLGGKGRSAEWSVWLPGRQFRSQFYVEESNIPEGLIGHVSKSRAGFCDVTGHANERTVLAAMIPAGAVCGNKVPTLQVDDHRLHLLWVAIANSFVIDWYIRRSVSTTINYHYLWATPFPWVAPTSSVGRSLLTLSKSLTAPRSCARNDLWRRAQMRADIDCHIAMLFKLFASELNEILDDFPLLDRGQPSPIGHASTITRDLLMARYARMLGRTDIGAETRVMQARSAGAIPYMPGQLASQLISATPEQN